MGRLRFELRTNRLKANWTSLRSFAAQGLRNQPPNTPPNRLAATGGIILPEKGQNALSFGETSETGMLFFGLRLALSPAVYRAPERKAGQDAQSLIHSLINPSLRTHAEESNWMLR